MSFRSKFCNSGLSDESEIASMEGHPFRSVFDLLFNIFLGIQRFVMLYFNPKLRVHHSVITSGELNVELATAVNLKM